MTISYSEYKFWSNLLSITDFYKYIKKGNRYAVKLCKLFIKKYKFDQNIYLLFEKTKNRKGSLKKYYL